MPNNEPLDLDALAAELSNQPDFHAFDRLASQHIRPLVERCKLAEEDRDDYRNAEAQTDRKLMDAEAAVANLTSQRNDLLVACKRLSAQAKMTEEGTLEGTLCSAIRQADKAIANVKGGADGKA